MGYNVFYGNTMAFFSIAIKLSCFKRNLLNGILNNTKIINQRNPLHVCNIESFHSRFIFKNLLFMIKNEDETARVHFAELKDLRTEKYDMSIQLAASRSSLAEHAANTSLSVIHRMIEFIFIVP